SSPTRRARQPEPISAFAKRLPTWAKRSPKILQHESHTAKVFFPPFQASQQPQRQDSPPLKPDSFVPDAPIPLLKKGLYVGAVNPSVRPRSYRSPHVASPEPFACTFSFENGCTDGGRLSRLEADPMNSRKLRYTFHALSFSALLGSQIPCFAQSPP